MKKLLIPILFLLFHLHLFAIEFTVDGINYATTSSNTVSVVKGDYTGDLSIHPEVTYSSIDYSVTSIGERAFQSSNYLTSISLPNTVTAIEDYAFTYCYRLESVSLPKSLDSIGAWAFYYDENLQNVIIPESVTYIGNNAFYRCKSFTNITIPGSVTEITDGLFASCINLETIELPPSITSIGSSAFFWCSSLISIEISESITYIGKNAFQSCSALMQVSDNNPNYSSSDGILYNKSKTSLIHCPTAKPGSFEIPNSVQYIHENAFVSCTGFTDIHIPYSVVSIGNKAFYNCSGIFTVDDNNPSYSSLDGSLYNKDKTTIIKCPSTHYGSFELLPSVKSIADGAFAHGGLTSIQIPSTVYEIGDGVFSTCVNLTNINFPITVSDIGSYTLAYCSHLKSITIPNSVFSVSSGLFKECSSLTSVDLPQSITSIQSAAFMLCTSLKSIKIPGLVNYVGTDAFAGCSSLESVYLYNSEPPETGSMVFRMIFNTSPILYVPVGTKSLYQEAETWMDFDSIAEFDADFEITFTIDRVNYLVSGTNTVAVISKGDYTNTLKIPTSVTFSEKLYTVETIAESAFSSCSDLTSVSIPDSIISIGNDAFANCTGLEFIYTYSSDPAILGSDVFHNVDKSTCTLFVPTGCLNQYQVANGWNEFENIQEFDITTGMKQYTIPVSFKLTDRVLEISNLSQLAQVSIYNLSGQIVYRSQVSPNEALIIPDLHEGVYIIEAKANSGVSAKKIIVQ